MTTGGGYENHCGTVFSVKYSYPAHPAEERGLYEAYGWTPAFAGMTEVGAVMIVREHLTTPSSYPLWVGSI